MKSKLVRGVKKNSSLKVEWYVVCQKHHLKFY